MFIVGKRVESPRVERFTLVLTERERRALAELARTAGISMSEFVRARLFQAREPLRSDSQLSDSLR
jgi:hypothetical protein